MNKVIGLMLVFLLVACNRLKEDKAKYPAQPESRSEQEDGKLVGSIHDAALNGNIDMVKQLLSNGLDVNSLDENGRSALMYAAYNGHLEIVRILIEKGADVNLTDLNKRTALMFAASGPFPETVSLLLEHLADPNVIDLPERYTAIMYAAAEGQLEVVKILLNRNADPTLKDADGDDALTFAFNNGHKEVIALIRSFINGQNDSEILE